MGVFFQILIEFFIHLTKLLTTLRIVHFLLVASLSETLGDIVSVGLFFQLLICVLCLAVYMISFESVRVINVRVFVSIAGATSIVASTYIHCFLSELVTRNLQDIGDIFYEFPWYRLPLKQQQLFMLPILRGQEEYRMTGLGMVECSLQTFSSVSHLIMKNKN